MPLFIMGFQMSGARPCSMTARCSTVRVPGSPTWEIGLAPACNLLTRGLRHCIELRAWLGDINTVDRALLCVHSTCCVWFVD